MKKPAGPVLIYIDGASRGNPGPASIGVAFFQDTQPQPVKTLYKYIGETTNNIAEYTALIYALQQALIDHVRDVMIRSDSELLVRQLNGEYRVRDASLRALHDQFQHLRQGFRRLQVEHVPREQNKAADRLANMALDERLDTRVQSL